MTGLSLELSLCGCFPPCRMYLALVGEDRSVPALSVKVVITPGADLWTLMRELVDQLYAVADDAGVDVTQSAEVLEALLEEPFPAAAVDRHPAAVSPLVAELVASIRGEGPATFRAAPKRR